MISNQYIRKFWLMVVLAIVLISIIGLNRPRPISSKIDKEKFWADKVHSKETYNVVVTGDSRIYRGIDPATISKVLDGLTVLNYGFSSGGHNPTIFKEIEERLVKANERRIIVLGLTPLSLTPSSQKNEHYYQEKNRPSLEILEKRFVNPLFHFFDPIRPTELIPQSDSIAGYYEDFKKNGWVASRKIPYDQEAALKKYRKNFKNNTLDQKIVRRMLDQVSTWVDQGIDVYAMRMPTTSAMEALENELSGFEEELIRRDFENAGGKWIGIVNRYSYFSYDGSHLQVSAAKQFSYYLGKKLIEKKP